eukprot:PhM_4_TR11687/c2_g1_i3/m.76300
MDDSVTVQRRVIARKAMRDVESAASGDRLSGGHESYADRPVAPGPSSCNTTSHKGSSGLLDVVGGTPSIATNHHSCHSTSETDIGGDVFRTLDKTLGGCSSPDSSARGAHPDAAGGANGEARGSHTFTAQHHDKVHQRQTPASVGERERESSAGPGPLRRRGAHFLGNTRPTRIPTTVEELALPLHAKRVRTLDLANLTELARGHVLERRLTELLPFVESATPYDSMVQRGTPVVSTITDSDLQAMKEAELVREVPASEVKNVRLWCKFFTVVEAAKQRRRIILWPRQGNAEVDYDCDIDLMSTLDHISQPTMGDWAACFDLTASFYQWPLNREVHNFFGFRDRSGRAFVFPLLFFETIFILLFSFGVNKVQK